MDVERKPRRLEFVVVDWIGLFMGGISFGKEDMRKENAGVEQVREQLRT